MSKSFLLSVPRLTKTVAGRPFPAIVDLDSRIYPSHGPLTGAFRLSSSIFELRIVTKSSIPEPVWAEILTMSSLSTSNCSRICFSIAAGFAFDLSVFVIATIKGFFRFQIGSISPKRTLTANQKARLVCANEKTSLMKSFDKFIRMKCLSHYSIICCDNKDDKINYG